MIIIIGKIKYNFVISVFNIHPALISFKSNLRMEIKPVSKFQMECKQNFILVIDSLSHTYFQYIF